MEPILKIEGLSKSFGKVMAVCELDLEVYEGEILGIIGPNGAGKTTMFNLISGDIRPDAGKVIFRGTDVTHLPTFRKCRLGISRTYQIPRPFANMTIFENLLVGSIYSARSSYKKSKSQCEHILETVGLADRKNAVAGFLPLYDRKRLELAKALATDPHVLLVDEVAGGLSEPEVEEVIEIINAVRARGVTVLWVEHIIMAMQKGPSRLLVMNFGSKLFCGRPDEALGSEEVQRIYLGTEED